MLSRVMRDFGRHLAAFLGRPTDLGYAAWHRRYVAECAGDRQKVLRHIAAIHRPPSIAAILLPGVAGAAGRAETYCSLHRQYRPFEAIMSVGDGAEEMECHPTLGAALRALQCDYAMFAIAGDRLAPDATASLAMAVRDQRDLALFYGDEDRRLAGGVCGDWWAKPDWSPELFLEQDYLTSGALAVARQTLDAVDFDEAGQGADALYRRALRWTGLGRATAQGGAKIYHWPWPLCRRPADARPDLAAQRAAVARLLGVAAEVAIHPAGTGLTVRRALPDPAPSVTILVPTRDRVDLLRPCIETLLAKTDYPNYEIVILDNDSAEPATQGYFASLAGQPRLRVLACPSPFNYAAINNRGAAATAGEILLFMNNDVEALHADWLTQMVAEAVRPEIGAVGAKLYYRNGRIQHAGVALGMKDLADHTLRGRAPDDPGPRGWLNHRREQSAVTGACLAVKRPLFVEVGGFSPTLAVAYNDVDLCLKIRATGRRNLWLAGARLIHAEMASRGADIDPDSAARVRRELAAMRSKWADALCADPYYNPSLSVHDEDCRPAFPPRWRPPWRY